MCSSNPSLKSQQWLGYATGWPNSTLKLARRSFTFFFRPSLLCQGIIILYFILMLNTFFFQQLTWLFEMDIHLNWCWASSVVTGSFLIIADHTEHQAKLLPIITNQGSCREKKKWLLFIKIICYITTRWTYHQLLLYITINIGKIGIIIQ